MSIYNKVHPAILRFQSDAVGSLLHEVWTKSPIPAQPVVVQDRPVIKGYGPVFFSTTDPGTGVTLPPEWFKDPSGE